MFNTPIKKYRQQLSDIDILPIILPLETMTNKASIKDLAAS